MDGGAPSAFFRPFGFYRPAAFSDRRRGGGNRHLPNGQSHGWSFWSWPLAGLVLLIDVGWYALAYYVGGNEFLRLQILHENVDRFLGMDGFFNQNTPLTTAGWLATRMLPWNLVLLWSLIRRVRGEREDSTGRFLHAWWIAIFSIFALSASARAVYLLPLYPAIALLTARATAATITRLWQRPGFDSMQKAPFPAGGQRRHLQMATRLGIGIALFDLASMLVNPTIWRDAKPRIARLGFIEKIDAIVPNHRPLFATPEIRDTVLIVMAYRLKREIDRKPMTSAPQNDYFLSPMESVDLAQAGTRVLAFSETDEVALVTAIPEKYSVHKQDNIKRTHHYSPWEESS